MRKKTSFSEMREFEIPTVLSKVPRAGGQQSPAREVILPDPQTNK